MYDKPCSDVPRLKSEAAPKGDEKDWVQNQTFKLR
jgi:hypothetical protein